MLTRKLVLELIVAFSICMANVAYAHINPGDEWHCIYTDSDGNDHYIDTCATSLLMIDTNGGRHLEYKECTVTDTEKIVRGINIDIDNGVWSVVIEDVYDVKTGEQISSYCVNVYNPPPTHPVNNWMAIEITYIINHPYNIIAE